MGIQHRWLDIEQTQIHIIFENSWSGNDFQAMVIHVRDMILTKNHLVHIIADFTNSGTPSSAILMEIPFAVRQIQANQGAIIILTQNETVHHLAKTAASMHQRLRQFIHVVDSLELAVRILAHYQKQNRAAAR